MRELGVQDYPISLGDGFEFRFGVFSLFFWLVSIRVGMVFRYELAIGGVDFCFRGVLR